MTTPRNKKPSSLRYYQDGPPLKVDTESYRLLVGGLSMVPVRLSLPVISELPRVTQSRRMVCVCNWSVRELWSGFTLSSVLELAGWTGEAGGLYLKQTSIGTTDKGVYDSTIPLGDALRRNAFVVDRIGNDPLPLERGFPLRLLDFALYGYKGVKGLASLEITDRFELGVWERKAAYALDGVIRPKRYRICDQDTHRYVDAPGEIADF